MKNDTPRRDTGGAGHRYLKHLDNQPARMTVARNRAQDYDITWSVDPGPKYNLATPEPVIGTIELDIIPTLDKFPKPTPRAETPTFPAGKTTLYPPHTTHRTEYGELPGGEYRVECRCGWSAVQSNTRAAIIAADNHHAAIRAQPEPAPHPRTTPNPWKEDTTELMPAPHHVVTHEANSRTPGVFTARCSGCNWIAQDTKLSELNRAGRAHQRIFNAQPSPQDKDTSMNNTTTTNHPSQPNQDPHTSVEVVEELPEGVHPEDQALVKHTHVLVNGSPVRVAKDGMFIDYGDDAEPGTPPGRVVKVNLELLIDDFRIRRVPAGYINRSHQDDDQAPTGNTPWV